MANILANIILDLKSKSCIRLDDNRVVSVSAPLHDCSPALRDISRRTKFCRNIKNWRVPSGWELNHLNFCANDRAHMQAELTLYSFGGKFKKWWREKRTREEQKNVRKGYYPASEWPESFASRVISPELFSNYRQTIIATDPVFEPRRLYDVPKILRKFAAFRMCAFDKGISVLIVVFALDVMPKWW